MGKMYAYKILGGINCCLLDKGYEFINNLNGESKFQNMDFYSHFITRQVMYILFTSTKETEWLGSMFYKEFENDFDEEPSYNVIFNPLHSDNWYLFSNQKRENRRLECIKFKGGCA